MAVALSHNPPQAAFTYNSARTGSSTNMREIEVTAQKYDFDPAVITVKQNEHIRLVITALDHDHGFKIDALHIDQLLKKGERTTVEFTANTPGTFPFQCSHFCGLGHKGMKGKLVVEAASQESWRAYANRSSINSDGLAIFQNQK
jgi:cytochrome c oxidase subunit 2